MQEVLNEYCKNVDVVIECVGNIKTQEQAVQFAGKEATVMLFGLAAPGESFPICPDDLFKKELKVMSSYINPYTFERAMNSEVKRKTPLEHCPSGVSCCYIFLKE